MGEPRRVVFVTGPPCAGKTTYVERHARYGDLVLDADEIGQAAMTTELEKVAYWLYEGTAYVIRCASGPTYRAKIAAWLRADDLVHLVPPMPDLLRRARLREASGMRGQVAAVRKWFREEQHDAQHLGLQRRVTKSGERSSRAVYSDPRYRAAKRALLNMAQDAQPWPCSECGEPIEFTAPIRSSRSPSVDHKVAIMDGGHPFDLSNMAIAHYGCNSRKGIRARHDRDKGIGPDGRGSDAAWPDHGDTALAPISLSLADL